MNDILYRYHEINLSQERRTHADSKLAPWTLELIEMDYLIVLSLDGVAQISIDRGDFFPLSQRMNFYLGGKRRKIEITNTSQPGKFLRLLISRKTDLEVIKP